jgi:hypothetical protein
MTWEEVQVIMGPQPPLGTEYWPDDVLEDSKTGAVATIYYD